MMQRHLQQICDKRSVESINLSLGVWGRKGTVLEPARISTNGDGEKNRNVGARARAKEQDGQFKNSEESGLSLERRVG